MARKPAVESGTFREELVDARQQIGLVPASGPPYDSQEHGDVRRILLSRTRYHVYYVVDEHPLEATILGVWHTSRGSAPQL